MGNSVSWRRAFALHVGPGSISSTKRKKKKKKNKNCSPYPSGTGALLYGKEALSRGHFHVLTDSGADTLPFLGLRSLPDCNLPSFRSPRVQSP